MNKKQNISHLSDLDEINAQVRAEQFHAQIKLDMENFNKQMDYLRSMPEVSPMITIRLSELRQSKSWLILQIGWTRKTYYDRINHNWFRPSEVTRLKEIFDAESERQKTAYLRDIQRAVLSDPGSESESLFSWLEIVP
jgi:hypothetical protein